MQHESYKCREDSKNIGGKIRSTCNRNYFRGQLCAKKVRLTNERAARRITA